MSNDLYIDFFKATKFLFFLFIHLFGILYKIHKEHVAITLHKQLLFPYVQCILLYICKINTHIYIYR